MEGAHTFLLTSIFTPTPPHTPPRATCRNADPGAKLVADGAGAVTRENRLLSWAGEIEAHMMAARQELRRARMELAAAHEVRGCGGGRGKGAGVGVWVCRGRGGGGCMGSGSFYATQFAVRVQ